MQKVNAEEIVYQNFIEIHEREFDSYGKFVLFKEKMEKLKSKISKN